MTRHSTEPFGVTPTEEGTRRVNIKDSPFFGLDRVYAVHDGIRRDAISNWLPSSRAFAEVVTYYVWRATPKCVVVSTSHPGDHRPPPLYGRRLMAAPHLCREDSRVFAKTPKDAVEKVLRKRRYHVKMAERRAEDARLRLAAVERLET